MRYFGDPFVVLVTAKLFIKMNKDVFFNANALDATYVLNMSNEFNLIFFLFLQLLIININPNLIFLIDKKMYLDWEILNF